MDMKIVKTQFIPRDKTLMITKKLIIVNEETWKSLSENDKIKTVAREIVYARYWNEDFLFPVKFLLDRIANGNRGRFRVSANMRSGHAANRKEAIAIIRKNGDVLKLDETD